MYAHYRLPPDFHGVTHNRNTTKNILQVDLTKGKGVPTYLWYKKGEVKDAITDIQVIEDKTKVPGTGN